MAFTYHGQGVNVDYIMYLASLHNIYFFLYYHLPDEYCGYYISQWDDDKELEGCITFRNVRLKKRSGAYGDKGIYEMNGG